MQTASKYSIESDKLILVQQHLRTLPTETIKKYAAYAEYLDLSHNRLRELSWLSEFENLKHLVLDCNGLYEAHLRTIDRAMPQLEVLMLNKNEFSDLRATVSLLRRLFPNLVYLSLHGNPICPDGLQLQPFSQYVAYDYEHYCTFISCALSKLKFLDHGAVRRVYRYESFNIVNNKTCKGNKQRRQTSSRILIKDTRL